MLPPYFGLPDQLTERNYELIFTVLIIPFLKSIREFIHITFVYMFATGTISRPSLMIELIKSLPFIYSSNCTSTYIEKSFTKCINVNNL